MVGRIARWFDTPWRVVPAQPILYLFLWIAAWHVIITTANTRLGFEEIGLGTFTYCAWNVLVLISPPVVTVAWLLIRHGHGTDRVWAFWLRLGGDMAMFAALLAYLTTRLTILGHRNDTIADSPLFSLITISGVEVLVGAFITVDIGALILLDRTARKVRKNQ